MEAFLRSRGAEHLAHPGGSLYEHLRRVAALLSDWGSEEVLQTAGLCHACYGTDGFDHALLEIANRQTLIELIGPRAEALVYLYCSCDRAAVYPLLSGDGPAVFRDRFTGGVHTPPQHDISAFLEVTAANELDTLAHNPALASDYGVATLALFTRTQSHLSAPAWSACVELLGTT